MCDENGECDVPEENRMRFWFLLPKDPDATYVTITIKYGDIVLSLRVEDSEEPDQAAEDLSDIWEYLPGLVKQARGERDIKKDMAGVDAELSALLEGDE